MTNEKHFPKTINQWEFDYGLFTNLPRILVARDFSSNSEEVPYLSWQNTYPSLKATCLIMLKFSLWTKLLENVLLAKHLISVAAPLVYAWLRASETNIVSPGEYFKSNSYFVNVKKASEYDLLKIDFNGWWSLITVNLRP